MVSRGEGLAPEDRPLHPTLSTVGERGYVFIPLA